MKNTEEKEEYAVIGYFENISERPNNEILGQGNTIKEAIADFKAYKKHLDKYTKKELVINGVYKIQLLKRVL